MVKLIKTTRKATPHFLFFGSCYIPKSLKSLTFSFFTLLVKKKYKKGYKVRFFTLCGYLIIPLPQKTFPDTPKKLSSKGYFPYFEKSFLYTPRNLSFIPRKLAAL